MAASTPPSGLVPQLGYHSSARTRGNGQLMKKSATKMVVVEGETLTRELLVHWLQHQYPEAEVSGHAGCYTFLSDRSAAEGAANDVVIVNAALPDGDCFDLMTAVTAKRKAPFGIVVMAANSSSSLFDRMTRTVDGGWALLGSSTDLAALTQAISAVQHGLVMVDPSLRGIQRGDTGRPELTDVEGRVMDLVALGNSNAAIATEVFLSEKSVERILGTVYQKFGIDRGSRDTNARVRACLVHLGLIAPTPSTAKKR